MGQKETSPLTHIVKEIFKYMNRITVIGAGKTGRGFLARLAAESNIAVDFIDKDTALIDSLQSTGQYTVHFFGGKREPVLISGYSIKSWEDPELSFNDLILVSVGQTNLPEVGKQLKEKLPTGKKYRIITCENGIGPASLLSKAIGLPNVQVSEAAVFCTTTDEGTPDIRSEDYPVLPFDSDLLPGYVPPISAFEPQNHFENVLKRKIYTYNAASAVIAYMGWLYGYKDYASAANDSRIAVLLDTNYASTNRAICAEFGCTASDQERFAALSRAKFCNPEIKDSIARNARDARRKLGKTERIIGSLNLLKKHEEDYSVLCKTAAAALLYSKVEESEITPPEKLLSEVSELNDDGTIEEIMNDYKTFSSQKA